MAYKIRRTRRKMMRRKMTRRRTVSKRLTQGKIYSFKRTCALAPYYFNGESWVQAAANDVSNDVANPYFAGIFKFRLNDLPGATDFTSLYEQFKITGVKLRFMPFIGTSSDSLAGTRTATLATCIDRGANDLQLVSPSFTSLLENQDVKLRNSQRGFSQWIGSPTFHNSADGLTQATYKAGWLDSERTGSRDVDYHGIKFSFQNNVATANSAYFKVYATYYVKCRNPQ